MSLLMVHTSGLCELPVAGTSLSPALANPAVTSPPGVWAGLVPGLCLGTWARPFEMVHFVWGRMCTYLFTLLVSVCVCMLAFREAWGLFFRDELCGSFLSLISGSVVPCTLSLVHTSVHP